MAQAIERLFATPNTIPSFSPRSDMGWVRSFSKHFQERLCHFARCGGDADSSLIERADFRGGRAFAAADDGAGMAHAPSRRGGGAGNEPRHRLAAMLLDPLGGRLFCAASDLTDQNDAMCLRVFVEQLEDIQMRHAMNGVAADADAGALADASAGELPDRFVGERAAA